MICRLLLVPLLVALGSSLAVAQAPPDEAQARQLSDEGMVHFNEGRYEEAIAAFEASFALHPLPVLLFDIAQAHRLAGRCPAAVDHYHRYLREAPTAANHQLVDGLLAGLEPCPAPPAPPPVVVAEPAPSATVVVPAAPPPRTPPHRRWWVWTVAAAAAALVAVAVGVGLGVGLAQSGPPTPSLGTVSWP